MGTLHHSTGKDSVAPLRRAELRLQLALPGLMAVLVATFVALLLVHLAVVSSYLEGWRFPGRDRFYFDHENNLPTFFSTLILLLAASLLGLIGAAKRSAGDRFARQWQWMALIFLGLAIDEAASLHELLIQPLRTGFQLTGALWYGWVIAGGPFAAGFAIAYLRFLRHLPRITQRLFVAAGTLYVGGAVGLEMLGAHLFLAGEPAQDLAPYMLAMTLEESFEMAGILLFNHALLEYLRQCCPAVSLELTRLPMRSPVAPLWPTRRPAAAGTDGGSAAA